MNKFTRISLLTTFLLFAFFANAQQTNIKKALKENTDFIINEDYFKSLPSGKELVEAEPNNANYNYRYGLALFFASSLIDEPLPYLKKASEVTSEKYDIFKTSETKAPIDAIFLYGVVLHRNNQIDEALKVYQEFKSKVDSKSPYAYEVDLKIKQANNAKVIQLNKNVKSLTLLPTMINSENSDFSPVVSFDGSRLFFTSSRAWDAKNDVVNTTDKSTGRYYEDIYVTDYDNDQWSNARILSFCSPTENEASVSVSIDERRVYLYNSSKKGAGDIFYSDFKGGNFEAIKSLNLPKEFANSWKPHYFVSADGKLAFLSSDVSTGYGGFDIYLLKRKADGSWSAPENLGPEINSPYNEDAPYLSFDGKYLYFSSDNDKSIGGYDIFRSEYKDGKFMSPENLGLPINSTYDDLYYTVTSDGLTAYISSFRDEGHGGLDIYQINYNESDLEIAILKGRVFMANSEETIPENIEVRMICDDCDDKTPTILLPRIRDGKFLANLEKCKHYSLTYYDTDRGEEIATQKFDTKCENVYEEIRKELAIEVDADGKIIPSMEYVMIGEVYDKETSKRLEGVRIEIQDKKGKTIQTMTTNKDGRFESSSIAGLKAGKQHPFKLIVEKGDYITITRDTLVLADFERIIDLGKIGMERNVVDKDLGKVLALNPIYYDLNSSYLRSDAKTELDKIVEAMNNNPAMKIELRSHTDCRESYEYNDWLSDRRASRAANYIMRRISNGSSRMTSEGYGESQLVNECRCDETDDSGCSEEQHQANRRTEFIIVSDLNKGERNVELNH